MGDQRFQAHRGSQAKCDFLDVQRQRSCGEFKFNERDIAEFRSWAKSEIGNGKKVYLFRFAVTDYTQEVLDVQRHGNRGGATSTTAYPISRTQQAVFLGFEMLTVTYNDRGKLTVIPVVQSPIHVFDDIDVYLQEQTGLSWWQIALALHALVILLVLLATILPYIIPRRSLGRSFAVQAHRGSRESDFQRRQKATTKKGRKSTTAD